MWSSDVVIASFSTSRIHSVTLFPTVQFHSTVSLSLSRASLAKNSSSSTPRIHSFIHSTIPNSSISFNNNILVTLESVVGNELVLLSTLSDSFILCRRISQRIYYIPPPPPVCPPTFSTISLSSLHIIYYYIHHTTHTPNNTFTIILSPVESIRREIVCKYY